MVKPHRVASTALSLSLIGPPLNGTLLASEANPASVPSASPAVDDHAVQPQPALTATPGRLVMGEQTLRAMNLSSSSPFAVNGSQPLGAVSAQRRGWYRGGGRRHGVAQTEMVLGAVATIAGAAVLTYANRPECSTNHAADGCGYGTKVIGTSVTAAGLVTFLAGALTWR